MNPGKLIPDYNPANALGLQERRMMMQLSGPQERLDYPTEIMKMANGCEVERYIIPEEDRQKVLDALYPFNDQPGLDDERLDIHTSRLFKVRDYLVTREGNGNFLVTPFYAEAGGTVLDWMMPDKAAEGGTVLCIGTVRR